MVILASLVLGTAAASALLAGLAIGPPEPAPGRKHGSPLLRLAAILTALAALSVIVAARAPGSGSIAGMETTGALWGAAHCLAAAAWFGVLLPMALVARGGARRASGNVDPTPRRWRWIALLALAVVAVTAAGVARSLDGWPALIGTRSGRLLLAQAVLLAGAGSLTWRLLAPAPSGADHVLRARGRARLLAIDLALGSTMVIVAVVLAGRAGAAEPTVWPFSFRLAPGIMLAFPSVQEQVVIGSAIAIAGLAAFVGAFRVKAWRPLLLALAVPLLVMGLYEALSAMTIDAYPTTYARPAVGGTEDSIRRGQALFAVNCVPCHGRTGRGDGPARAGLLQRPADLTASHTADHTPGDVFWWISHGLGLAMPAFGERLSVAERWDLVNFVRTLATAGDSPPTSAR